MKTEFDEFVKIHCKITQCYWNKKGCCGVKNIIIGVSTINDYPHGINGVCQAMTNVTSINRKT